MRRAALALVAVSVLTACSAGPSNRPVIAVRGEENQPVDQSALAGPQPVPPLGEYKTDSLQWSQCDEQMKDRFGADAPQGDLKYECARMTAVLDPPGRPGRGQLGIALTRVGTGKSALVVVNDPGGEPGTLKAARLAAALPKDVLSTYTIIGVDRRGTGRSDGMSCVPPATRALLMEYDPAETEQSNLVVAAGEASQECVLDLEGRLTAFDSWRAAADLERLREFLGSERLNAIGLGEGSRVITTYAQRYPNRIGRTVLDGAPDPALDQVGVLESRAVAAEATFDAFARDCKTRGCALANPREDVAALLTQLRSGRVRGEYLDLTPGSALNAIVTGLADRAKWPALADSLVKARAGDSTGLFALLDPLVNDLDENPPRFDAGLIIGCNDTSTRIPPDRVKALTADWQSKHAMFGALFARQLLHCNPFVPPKAEKVEPLKSAPPIVVLSTANDASTPAPGTEHAAQRLPGSALVAWQGSGHGALGLSGCATTAARDYLVDAKVPSNGTVCPP
ncbi:alpha/beta fold hydrolase [Lentzea sp. HUAS12]|uniref:alpha/beta fold hydrolase n=1 Tax=Lentzea sp. HUAS12 TaxID=2951806 RepID=UPI00209D5498|nr:alpha/beta fold hydrolase [Lentzea sp. HUAS12]USX56544.1 alpha/beta hydrolase [Lentzea sp. HUAS12]